jgi:L-seryl-tRNA(Ser) seleniumtransferase
LQAFASGRHETRVPVYRILSATLEELRARGERIVAGSSARIVESRAALGGGTTPTQTIPSLSIHVPGDAGKLHQRFLHHDVPIVGRVQEGRFLLDLRTMLEGDEEIVRDAVMG